jgi:Histidine kinase-, DNA gyrase B-, and HSP90-like ATPase
MPQVKIGSSYFRKSLSDYSNWKWAWAREAAQNAIDSGADEISVIVNHDDGKTFVTFTDNGCGMDEHTITEKLFAIGESGKNFEGSVGGFGIAKVVLFCAHEEFLIHTRNLVINGSGGSYEITKVKQPRTGTAITVFFKSDIVSDMTGQIRRFFALSGWRGDLTINGEKFEQRLNLGAARRDLGWCKVHTNKSYENLMVVRLGTQPMFIRPVRYKGCVVITLEGASAKFLTSNRDSLSHEYQSQLDEFVNEIATETKSAFREKKQPTRSVYHGYKLAGAVKATPVLKAEVVASEKVIAAFVEKGELSAITASREYTEAVKAIAKNVSRMEFHVYDDACMKIPDYYVPENFSDYSRTLAERWASILIEIATLELNSTPFSIGFVFSEDNEGQHENGVLYINPVKITEREGKPRSMSRRWTFNNDGNWNLVSVAAHEWIHFIGNSAHDEDYAGAYTELMGRILANREKFGKIFCGQGKVKWPE